MRIDYLDLIVQLREQDGPLGWQAADAIEELLAQAKRTNLIMAEQARENKKMELVMAEQARTNRRMTDRILAYDAQVGQLEQELRRAQREN